VKDHYERTVQDFDSGGRKIYFLIHITRYVCQEPVRGRPGEICGKTFQADLEMIDEKSRLTKRFRDYLAEEALDRPFLSVAKDAGVSIMTVKRAAEAYFKEKEKWRLENLYCPVGIGIDEKHIGGQFCLVITDNDQHTLLDMFNNKDPETVRSVLESLKRVGSLQYVTMDMCLEYRSAVYEVFGQTVVIIADRFHVQKSCSEAMMKVRSILVESLPADQKAGTKNGADRLRINLENLTDYDKECMERMFEAVPLLRIAYALKEAFRSIYNYKSRARAEAAFERFCREIPKDEAFEPFRRFVRTVRQWHTEIFAYFDFNGASNGFTEAENALIGKRNIKGNGYSFETLRNLMLYGKGSTSFHPNHQLMKK
jgi:transposase